jgi:hypothetical protein
MDHPLAKSFRGKVAAARLASVLLVFSVLALTAAPPFDTAFIGRTVVFLYAAAADGNPDVNNPVGTGFLMRVPHLHDDKLTLLLVTARHMFDPEWVHCPGKRNPALLFARVNAVEPTSPEKVKYIRVPLSKDGKSTWFKHRRDDIDAAVMTFPINDEDLLKSDIRFLPVWRLPTKEELGRISIGDDIVSAGMLVDLRRTTKNYPIFKFGKVSNILEEDIQTGCGGEPVNIVAWVIAANLVSGNSGSPIFYYPPFGENADITSPGLDRLVLLGIQSSSVVTSDVAYMTPATFLVDIIEEMKLPDVDLYLGKKTAK